MTKAPYILICGGAGSGKDTLGGMLASALDGVCVAQADPMKQLAKLVFEFTDDQLWGPSESRNAPDPRFDTAPAWDRARLRLGDFGTTWLYTVLPEKGLGAFAALSEWFFEVARVHGFELSKWPGEGVVPTVESLFPDFKKRSLTARYVLQTLGTEFGRQQDPRMWNRYAFTQGDLLLAGGYSYDREHGAVADTNQAGLSACRGSKPYGVVVVTDGRFPNEAIGVKQRGGYLINVLNPESDNSSVEKAGVSGHASEKGIALIPRHWYDAMVVNDKANGLQALERVVETFVKRLQQGVELYATVCPTEVMRSC